jgi:hypothetical protein
VDSIGFIFKCEVEEGVVKSSEESYGHEWMPLVDLENLFHVAPYKFDFLTHGLLNYYFYWSKENRESDN